MIRALLPLLMVACGPADAEPLAELLLAASAPRVSTPTFSPAGGAYTSAQSVTVRTSSTGAAIYCTTDGTKPRRSASLRYSSPLSVGTSQTVRCIAATLDGRQTSLTGTAVYTINIAPPAVAGAACDGSTSYSPGSEPMRSNGRPIHYYCNCPNGTAGGCPGSGTDKADCTNSAAPCQTLGAALAKFGSMGAGETVALCRGGEWSTGAGGYYNNANCRAGSTGWPPSANNADTCDLRDYGNPALPRPKVNADKLVALNGTTQGHRIWNIHLSRALQPYYGNEGILIYEQAQYNDFCNLRIEGGALGVHISGQTNNYNSVRSSQFYNVAQDAILVESSNLTIDSNYMENCGTYGTSWPAGGVHAIYNAAYGSSPAVNEQITNNEIVAGETCYGPQIVLHGQHTAPVLRNNIIRSTGSSQAYRENCYGYQLSKSDNVTNLITAALIQRNRAVNMPGTAMEVSDCTDCIVTDNIIQNGNVSVGTSMGGFNGPTTRVTLQNNSIVGGGINFGSQGDGYVIENNAIWTTTGNSCLNNVQPTLRNAYNVCRNDGSAATLLWADPANGDFRPVIGGPLDNLGDPSHYSPTAIGSVTWSPTDTGTTRNPANGIDIGAMVR